MMLVRSYTLLLLTAERCPLLLVVGLLADACHSIERTHYNSTAPAAGLARADDTREQDDNRIPRGKNVCL
jgi:hypothetical protein